MPVSTRHAAANEVIAQLREAAQAIKRLGDEQVQLEERLEAAENRRDEALDQYEAMRQDNQSAQHVLDEWQGLLEDLSRGIRDTDEVLERTVGRRCQV